MSLQKINKKPFKSPFANPAKNSASHQQKQIPLWKHEDPTQDQIMVKTLPQAEEVNPNIKRNTTSNSMILKKNFKKGEKKEKLPITSLTDTEYDDIFSSVISKVMAGAIRSPVMEHNAGSSGDEVEIENRAVIPKPDEAQSPHEVAEGPVKYITTKVQSQQPFSRKGRMAPFINANKCVTEAAQTKDSFSSKKRNFEDMQGITKKTKDNKFNSCALPEKTPTPLEEEDLIHNVYTAGSIVWGRLSGFPWWPAIVDDDPDTEQYYWLNGFSDIPTHYNVAFFDEKEVTRAWLTPGAMTPFTGNENSKEFKKTIAHGIDYTKRLQVARLQAQKALLMTTAERLRAFGFLARYKGQIGSIKKKKKQQQDTKKHAENEGTYSQNTDEYEKLDAYRNLQEEEEKQKPKRKRAKQFNILKPYVKKIKGQPANNEGNNISEATDNISKIENNNVQENNSSHRPNQTSFNSSLYTQELSSQESENFNEKPFTHARSKPMEFESMNEIMQNASSPTKAENVSLQKCTQPSTNNERQEATDEMQIPQDYGSETQFRVASKQSEDIINCSQDFFLSQVGSIEQNMLQKKKVGTYSGTTDIQGLNKSSISGQANCRNVNGPCEKNKASEITVDSCMATVGETSGTEQIKATNSPIKVVEEDTGNMLGSRGDLPDDRAMTEIDISIQSVLQHDISNLSTSIAPTGSHSNCSDKVPLVPNSQFETPSTKAGQLVDQNCDAVVPELNIEDFDKSSNNSVDFEVEE